METRPKIAILTTGGTIASRLDPVTGKRFAQAGAEYLLAELIRVPGVTLPEVIAEEIISLNSFAMSLEQAETVIARIGEMRARPDISGIVVTHGTDTMEETAFLADFLLKPGKPVVFTGAQASYDDPARDGPRNLTDAVLTAASPALQGAGALIVFDGEIFAARDATKTHTSRWKAFGSRGLGPLGQIDHGHVHLLHTPLPRPALPPLSGRLATPVDLITLSLGGDDRLMRLAAENGAKAIVLQAFGRGNATPTIAELTAQLTAKGVPVVVTSRCAAGRVAPVYSKGGGQDLAKAGAIFAGDLAANKARLLLAALLSDLSPADAVAAFTSFIEAI